MPSVVVIGGGFAGALVARSLEKDFSVTLIDNKDYFEFTPSILRTLVEPAHVKKIQVLHSHYLHRAHLVRDCVVDITDTKVVCAHEGEIAYDYAVIASGSSYHLPIKEPDVLLAVRGRDLRAYSHRLDMAKSVLIVGGGLVGVELAAEIVTHYPNKDVTLVQSGKTLIPRMPVKAQKYTLQFLEKRGVTVIFGHRVSEKKGGVYVTEKGEKISSDLVFMCVGITPNYSFLSKHFTTSLSTRNFVSVNDYLQVPSHPHIFVAGDIAELNEEKTAQRAEDHAQVVSQNILSLSKGKDLRTYVSRPLPMVVSLGLRDGFFAYKDFVFCGVLPALLKQFVEWKSMRRYR